MDSHLDMHCRHLLHALCRYIDREGLCHPSQETLARVTGMSRQSVRNHLDHLIRAGWLTMPERERRALRRAPLLYQLRVPEDWDDPGTRRPKEIRSKQPPAAIHVLSPTQSTAL